MEFLSLSRMERVVKKERACNGENRVKRRAVNVGILGFCGRPVEEAVSGNVVGLALHIYKQAKRGNRGERIFEMSISQLPSVGFPMQVWIMANNLCEIVSTGHLKE